MYIIDTCRVYLLKKNILEPNLADISRYQYHVVYCTVPGTVCTVRFTAWRVQRAAYRKAVVAL